jgi:hypothetical protein
VRGFFFVAALGVLIHIHESEARDVIAYLVELSDDPDLDAPLFDQNNSVDQALVSSRGHHLEPLPQDRGAVGFGGGVGEEGAEGLAHLRQLLDVGDRGDQRR